MIKLQCPPSLPPPPQDTKEEDNDEDKKKIRIEREKVNERSDKYIGHE